MLCTKVYNKITSTNILLIHAREKRKKGEKTRTSHFFCKCRICGVCISWTGLSQHLKTGTVCSTHCEKWTRVNRSTRSCFRSSKSISQKQYFSWARGEVMEWRYVFHCVSFKINSNILCGIFLCSLHFCVFFF